MPEKRKTRVFYADFGCRLNQFETRVLKNTPNENLITTKNQKDADFIVINTCTVTHRADLKNRHAIRKAREKNPHAHIIVTGCFATTDAISLKGMKEVDTVIENSRKFTIPDIISGNVKKDIMNPFPVSFQNLDQNARAYLKIQDGCNKSCSYCKIPVSRGKAISRDIQDTLMEVANLVNAGFQEIILTGVNIGHYQNQKNYFTDLLKQLQDIPGQHYYRISSLEPDAINTEFLDIISAGKFARFLHIPLQSGSEKILKTMHRGYGSKKYRDIIYKIKERMPEVHLGTDVIVGFPSETEEDFEMTFQMVENLEFSNVHIFPFSRRPGSEVDSILSGGQVKESSHAISSGDLFEIRGDIIRKRIQRLISLQEKNKKKYLEKTAGIPFKAIVEKVTDNNCFVVTENYFKGNLITNKSFLKGSQIQIVYDSELNFTLVE